MAKMFGVSIPVSWVRGSENTAVVGMLQSMSGLSRSTVFLAAVESGLEWLSRHPCRRSALLELSMTADRTLPPGRRCLAHVRLPPQHLDALRALAGTTGLSAGAVARAFVLRMFERMREAPVGAGYSVLRRYARQARSRGRS